MLDFTQACFFIKFIYLFFHKYYLIFLRKFQSSFGAKGKKKDKNLTQSSIKQLEKKRRQDGIIMIIIQETLLLSIRH